MRPIGYSAALGRGSPSPSNTTSNSRPARPIFCCWSRWTGNSAACSSTCTAWTPSPPSRRGKTCAPSARPGARRSPRCNPKKRGPAGPHGLQFFTATSDALLDVQSALLAFRILPPPAAGANVLPAGGRAGAGCAAEAGIELVVQLVVGHAEVADVIPNVVVAPLDQRIEFLQAVASVPLGYTEVGACRRLLAAQTGDPGFFALERALQRFHLADMAAALAQVDAVVKRVGAVLADITLDLFMARKIWREAFAVADDGLLH